MTELPSETAGAPWSWPEEQWRAAVAGARAGQALRPKKWKGGARCAVAITFDCTFETAALTEPNPTLMAISRGQYGARAGLPRILRLLKRHNVQATFFLPAVAALLHPEQCRSIGAAGHEIGLHSWINEARSDLQADTERELLNGARSTLEKVTGMKPVGVRGGRAGLSSHTLGILREMGLTYDSSLAGDDDAYELTDAGLNAGIVELPIGPTDAMLRDATTPEAVFDIFRRELEVAYEEGGLMVLALDPGLIGRRANLWVLDEIIKVARTLPGVWLTTCADIAVYARTRAG